LNPIVMRRRRATPGADCFWIPASALHKTAQAPHAEDETRTIMQTRIPTRTSLLQRAAQALRLAPEDLLRDAVFRRLWTSVLISSLGGQVTMLALPLTAAVLLHATPTQMGWLLAAEIAPFVLLSLPAGVWLDRVRKLPIYIAGEATLAVAVVSVPLAWWAGALDMRWMIAVALVMGSVHAVAGSAAQIVLTQVVPRERLVEAHARNALASSGADVIGPGLAGVLIKAVGAPVALLVDAVMLIASTLVLKGLRVQERVAAPAQAPHFMRDLRAGLAFVRGTPLLVAMACAVGLWHMAYHAALTVQILFATRVLGMNESQIGLAFVALGAGTVGASAWGHRLAARIGPGPVLLSGIGVTGVGWLALAAAPVSAPWAALGPWVFAFMLLCFGVGAVLIFITFLAMRQAATPDALLGRMTSTMRWLILLPAGPGALIGGWLGEHVDLRAALLFAGIVVLTVAAVGSRLALLAGMRALPRTANGDAHAVTPIAAVAAVTQGGVS
jgi:MFS family permease